jgi:molecular chaperone GrpE
MTAKSIAIDIADKASNLLQKLKFKDANLEFISVFSQSIDEYDTYTEELLEEGEVAAESSTGVFIKLERPLSTSLGVINIIKVRKPSEDRNSLGNVNYSVTDFQAFLNHYSNSDYFSVSSDSEGIKLATLEEPSSDYFVVVRESSLLNKLLSGTESVSEYSSDEDFESNDTNTDALDTKVAELEQKLQEETNRRLSLMSDFQNYQKRIEGEKSLFGAMANMGIISSILEIHDDLELAMNDETLDLENAKHAMKTAQSKIVQTVASAGVEAIMVKVGDEFNKEHMEAVSMIQAPNEEMKGKVIAVISSAYKYKDREGVFKPAKVVVGK